MKTNNFLSRNLSRLTLAAAFFCTTFAAQAQKYAAVYDDNTYKVIDQTSLDDMLAVKKHTYALPIFVFAIKNDVPVADASQLKANGAGTRSATSQASIKPGLKSATPQNASFDILCDCTDGFYARGSATAKENDCASSCTTIRNAIAKDMANFVSFFQKQGIDISNDKTGKTDKEKAKGKAAKAKK